MRVLVVSPYPVWPPTHGGRVRVAGLARGLADAGADATVLSPWHPRQPTGVLGPLVEHRTHALPASALTAVGQRVAPGQALLSLEPHRLLPRRVLRSLGRFDVYQFEFCAQSAWMDLVPPGAAVVYSAHNVEREFFETEAHRYLVRGVAARRLEKLERRAVRRADLVVTCTRRDSERLAELYGEHRSAVVPNGCLPAVAGMAREALRAHSRRALGIGSGEHASLFVGGGSEHNREAVSFLAREVAPGLPDGRRLLLAGTSSSEARRLRCRGVSVLGYQGDLRPLLAAADLGINPVAAAAGSSVKVAEYLGGGLPVLATTEGARGHDRGPRLRVVPRERFAAELHSHAGAAHAGLGADWGRLGSQLHAELAAL